MGWMNVCEKDYLFSYALERDLKRAIASLPKYRRVLDVGSTWKPYRELFSDSCEFKAANIKEEPGVDYVVAGAHHMPQIADNSIDVILCTQVLEHVPDPAAALAEFRRILKPEGALILSTHGVFHYHPYPHDYWRWTSEGLKKVLDEHFQTSEILPNGGSVLLLFHIVGRGLVFAAERRWWLKWLQYTAYPVINILGLIFDKLISDYSLSINYVAIARRRAIGIFLLLVNLE